ncbi:hypothetical protein KEM55_008373 [Ascosphaera atra]|nr:hypothetical protein KEM55_008373 [Ascosphaera atra]
MEYTKMAPKKAANTRPTSTYTLQLCATCTEQYRRNPEIEVCKRSRGPKKNCDKCKDDKKRCKTISFALLSMEIDVINAKQDHDAANGKDKGRLADKVMKLAEELLAAISAEKQGGAIAPTTANLPPSALINFVNDDGDDVFDDNGDDNADAGAGQGAHVDTPLDLCQREPPA